ncbi:MAG: IS3 family transposase, partial [Terracidiphilus sp.]
MRKSRYTEEQIVGILKESEAGLETAELCRKHGISDKTFYRWKAKYGGLEVSEAQRLRQLEEENRKLKQLVAEQALDNRRIQGGAIKKVVSPQARREAVAVFRTATDCSERHACGQLEVLRAMLRYRRRETRFAEANGRLRVRLRELAEDRRRWGYRRLHVLLQREGWTVNSKRVYRIYVEEKLMVRRRKRRRRICAKARVLLAAPIRKNETWTMDFLQDALASGRKLRTLSIEDAYTREMLAIEVDTSLPALRVVRVLDRLRQHRGMPVRIVIDNGTEFTSKALDQWAYENKVTLHFITPGRPMENGYIESFHGKFREECLNEHWFLTLDDARETIESWRIDYNRVRPHSALGY